MVAAGYDCATDLRALKRFLRECHPVLIGVEAGADALQHAGYRPHLIVGDPNQVKVETLHYGGRAGGHRARAGRTGAGSLRTLWNGGQCSGRRSRDRGLICARRGPAPPPTVLP